MIWMCKLIGHVFAGYISTKDNNRNVLQVMPSKFFCTRCNSVVSTQEGWN